ncbi:hypothetical protein JCM10449v2_004846 [Rhodotorula kratochvilovae]
MTAAMDEKAPAAVSLDQDTTPAHNVNSSAHAAPFADEKRSPADSFQDSAFEPPRQEDSSEFTEEERVLEKAAVRRLDWTVLPLAAITYLLNFLDRSNIGKYV